ncbi:MAG: NAD(P)-dependent glycerol-3-phosphate dehydrogenase [Gammaproteobacteria bacterium]|nr:NAD(P)-dependent glycerol-3-phosphate dehydrogenase [Gammaproteobacteria bacterium]
MDSLKPSVAVIGAGSWGTALAMQIARCGQPVLLWGRDSAMMQEIQRLRINPRYLPDITLPPSLTATADLAATLAVAKALLLVVPSAAFALTIAQLQPGLTQQIPLAWATKGVDQQRGELLHEVVDRLLGKGYPTAVISGPTFAHEVALGLPTAVTVAAAKPEIAQYYADLLHGENFRAYTSDDMISVEVGGATKNVLAIAAGIADGLGFGANARTALITRGLAELMRLGEALGGRRETMMGLSGLGDLLLTSTDNQSRNRRVGIALGEGKTLAETIAAIGQAVEGVDNARQIYALAQQYKIETPIIEQVYRVLHEGLAPTEAVRILLQRSQKQE